MKRRVLLGLLGVLVTSLGCALEKPPPARSGAKTRRLDAIELFPADLDIVVRVDVARMRVALGPTAEGLSARVGTEIDLRDVLASKAIQRARVVWIGLRIADIEAGDRVLVIEGDVEDLRPDPVVYHVVDPPLVEGVTTYEQRGPIARDAIARIHLLGPRTIVFVSGVEVDGVERVLQRGADPGRRDPPAEGLVSADVRARRLPPELERKFPSIGSIIRGVKRARASVTMADEGLRAEIEISTASEAAATKLDGFVQALREGGQGSRYSALFEGLRVERIERAVHMKWIVPVVILRNLIEST